MQKNFCLLLLSLALVPRTSHSKEGFNDTPAGLPPAVAAAWDSVFHLVFARGADSKFGTAFLIGQDNNYLYFATANHNLKNRCPDDQCQNTSLRQATILERPSAGQPFAYASKGPLSFSEVLVHKRTGNPDFAILKVPVEANTDRSQWPRPLRLNFSVPKLGERLYLIGFPHLHERTCTTSQSSQPTNRIMKRWSEGVAAGISQSDMNEDSETKYWISTTIDALIGNSGGPILNVAGEVISVQVRSATYAADGFCYNGSEYPARIKHVTYGIRNPP